MWDDHDIFNNWGSRLTESPLDRRMFEAATRVYGEYQHPRNPGGKIGPPPFFYTFRYGTAGFVVLDLRGARDYRIGRLMGASQWEELRQYLAGPDAAEVETLFIVASVPVAHHSRWIVRLLGQLPEHFADDVRDRWCSPHFIASRNELLDELFAWQERAPGRQAVLLSGDVHCASAFTIGRRGQPGVIQQFTSSALSTPDTGFERFVNVVGSRAPNLFESRFRFKRRFLALENNFGLVQVEPLPAGGHRVTYSVRAWHPKRGKLMDGGRVVTVPRSGLPAKE
jgi:alkaline phosphatase D